MIASSCSLSIYKKSNGSRARSWRIRPDLVLCNGVGLANRVRCEVRSLPAQGVSAAPTIHSIRLTPTPCAAYLLRKTFPKSYSALIAEDCCAKSQSLYSTVSVDLPSRRHEAASYRAAGRSRDVPARALHNSVQVQLALSSMLVMLVSSLLLHSRKGSGFRPKSPSDRIRCPFLPVAFSLSPWTKLSALFAVLREKQESERGIDRSYGSRHENATSRPVCPTLNDASTCEAAMLACFFFKNMADVFGKCARGFPAA